jgi:4-amino-4-deoxy-L-arabinose transferase-like glycosyltransferase
VIDTSLLSSVLLMQGALWVIYQEGIDKKQVPWGWACCFWLAMAYGLLLKGVTPLVGILSIVTLCLIERQVAWLGGLRIFRGLLLFFTLSLIWLFMVNSAEHSNYLMQMIHKDLLPKLQGGHESHGQPPLFHLIILPITFWPASLFLWQGGVYAINNRRNKFVKFLLAWLLPTWLFFEIMPTKLPQYVLPTFPAIAILCSLAIAETTKANSAGKWLFFLQVLWGILSLALAAGLTGGLFYFLMQKGSILGIILFTTISLISFIAVYSAWQNTYQRACLAVFLLALVTYPVLFTNLLPQLKPLWLTSNIAQLIDKNRISKEKPLLAVDFGEPSLVFNLNTNLVQFTNNRTAETILQSDTSRLALVKPATFEQWVKAQRNLAILARADGYNYTKGHWVELFVVGEENARKN